MEKELIKIDKNGSKHYRGYCTCDRCNGKGIYYTGIHNGELVAASPYNGTCYKCNGKGKVLTTWIERTPEYQAKLDARREAKQAAAREKAEQIEKARKERERAREQAEKERKAISQYIGSIGDRIKNVPVTFIFVRFFDGFYGTTSIMKFKDDNGNVIIWKTNSSPEILDKNGNEIVINEGTRLYITGTIKEHNEYNDEKQTILTRCKLTV